MKDPIVAEVRRHRHEHERKCGQDLDAILADIQKHQASCGLRKVRLPANRIAPKRRRPRNTRRAR